MVNRDNRVLGWRSGAGMVVLTAALTACGGGGSSGSQGGAVNLNCGAAANATQSGYSLGVCSAGGSNRPVFRGNLDTIGVTINDYAAKSYTLNLNEETGPNPQLAFGAANEDRCNNLVGAARVLVQTNPNPATGPYAAVLSATQTPQDPTPDDTCVKNGGGAALPPIGTIAMAQVDFGTWERWLSGQSFYYGGWFTARNAGANAKPAGAKSYGDGRLIGYVYTPLSSFGMLGPKMTLTIDAANVITGTATEVQNSRTGFNANLNAQIVSLNLNGGADPDGKFRGTLTGQAQFGVGGDLQPIKGGGFEGQFFGPNGEEFAARWWVQLSDGAIAIGSFGGR